MNTCEAHSMRSQLRSFILATILGYLTMTNAQADQGIVKIRSQHDVSKTLQRLEKTLAEHGLTILALITLKCGNLPEFII
jgi:hypothetical protein